jgi:propanediol dehydratase large subunit
MKRQKRFEVLEQRDVHKDGFVQEWVEEGLISMESPNDPKGSITIVNDEVVELDGKRKEDFDLIDHFIARYGIELDRAEEVAEMDPIDIAQMLVNPNVPKKEIVEITTSMTPGKAVEVLNEMNVVEMMMAQQKMRARRTVANQAHNTNTQDNPVLLAADGAEGALRGFAEMESTTAVARSAPLNAMATFVGTQVGRPGVITQCSSEEAVELDMGIRGLNSYAETISVYGTEDVFTDGDDTPWSKGFLASAYASRGVKMRFTSGTGSEVQMGYAEGKSMLYLEARCIFLTKAAGVQGLQNGSISCIGVPAAVPSGIRAVLGENLLTAMLDLENASGNDQSFSHTPIRRTARMLMQMLPGTDYIFSGYAAQPNYDNMFAGSNFDADDYDDYLAIQRDLKVDGGLRPVTEEDVIRVRNKAAQAIQGVFEHLGLPAITDEEVEAATYAHGTKEVIRRDINADLKGIEELMDGGLTGLDIVRGLAKAGFEDVAQTVLDMLKQRTTGDFLQTAAIFDEDFNVISAVNDQNDYEGPGTGYRLEGEEWEKAKDISMAIDPRDI